MNSAIPAIAALSILIVTGCQAPPTNQARTPTLAAQACTNQNLSPEAIFSNTKQAVAVVNTENSLGSAFVIRHQEGNSPLVTNAHVVEGVTSVTLKWADGNQDTAAVLSTGDAISPQNDLALLEAKGVRGTPLQLKIVEPNVGAEVVAIGSPIGLEFSLTRGVVSGLRDDGEILQIDASINPGNSGGPVLDRTGCVIGVATFKLTDGEGLSFAVASSVVQGFLSNPVTQQPQPSIKPLPTPANPHTADGANPDGETCWFQMEPGSDRLEGARCSFSSRKNANGHNVFDVVEPNGLTRTVVLWKDGSAEVVLNARWHEGEWIQDEDGDIRISVNGGVFAFRYR